MMKSQSLRCVKWFYSRIQASGRERAHSVSQVWLGDSRLPVLVKGWKDLAGGGCRGKGERTGLGWEVKPGSQ